MSQRTTIGEYIDRIKTAGPTMISDIQELAKAEIKPAAKHGGIGAVFFGIAAVIGATALFLVLITIGFAFSILFNQLAKMSAVTSLALGFLCLFVLCLILLAIFGMLGLKHFKKVKAPEATIAEAKASLSAVGSAIEAGVRDAEAGTANRSIPAGSHPADSTPIPRNPLG